MLTQLFTQLFKHLEKDVLSDKPSKNGLAVYFVENVLEEQMKVIHLIGVKSMKGYYDKYVEGKENKSGVPAMELCNLIANYLGYDSFIDFELKNKEELLVEKSSVWIRLKQGNLMKRAGVSIGTVALLLSGVYYNKTVSTCIEWDGAKYISVSCNNADALLSKKVFNASNFQKIQVNENTIFFKNGRAVVWYLKTKKGPIEYFNSRGVHPISGKELKPVTIYIVDKYVK